MLLVAEISLSLILAIFNRLDNYVNNENWLSNFVLLILLVNENTIFTKIVGIVNQVCVIRSLTRILHVHLPKPESCICFYITRTKTLD